MHESCTWSCFSTFPARSLERFHARQLKYGCYVWKLLISSKLKPGIGISLWKTVIGEIHETFVVLRFVFISWSTSLTWATKHMVVAVPLWRSHGNREVPRAFWVGGAFVYFALFQRLAKMRRDILWSCYVFNVPCGMLSILRVLS